MPKPQHVELTSEQENLVKRLGEWYRSSDRQWFSYTGAAGTGKTTVIKAFIEALGIEHYQACAYVGKAVTVLSRHGLPASTIHSMIYDVMWLPVLDKLGNPVIKDDGRPKMKVEFSLKPHIKGDPELLIVDEATMVNDELADDILSFGIKTVFIGDNNQLPPVFGVSSVMLNPDFWLTKIMRQKEGDPIVYLSQKILKREFIPYGQYGKSAVVPYVYLGANYKDYDCIITATNRARDDINNHIRHNVLNIASDVPVLGDKLICRQNNWDRSVEGNIYLTNGMIGYVTDINRSLASKRYMSIDFKPEISDEEFYDLRLDTNYIVKSYDERKLYGISHDEKFEYAYAVTCHSMQGSSAPNVLFLDQWFHDAVFTKKIRYTAITRAEESVTIASAIRFV